ncbi:TetR/AcrR family transcriptional regulator [Companilactobacillus nantensis]|uniref:Regulatory protein TetR n=1 Tax=Companilactobacillus nantensis DSM 16982 TaxID=1423774 RepID=A0A0R1WJ63_9LACO|nr:TetR/AcrR family transcriptional regulator [Companilactobacillus nantensis]KRM17970.1 regulatory protein TetR [Companilactobacillus nantensis DSM 16982]GEO63633.1 transcriptional regulator [Companilactobacillus nantensis]
MVSTTFDNLNESKKILITDALLNEFSNHNLASAQVSRIVKESGIARGAFYKYFDDLTDAYNYLYHLAMRDIHQKIATDSDDQLRPNDYVEQVRDFIEKSTNSRYFALVKMHLLYNESTFLASFNNQLITENEFHWATQVMIHDAIKQIMVNPESKEIILQKLAKILRVLAKEDD